MKEAMSAKKSVLMKLISMMDDETSEKLKPNGGAIEIMKIEGKPLKHGVSEEMEEETPEEESMETVSEMPEKEEEEDDEEGQDFSMLEQLRKKYQKD